MNMTTTISTTKLAMKCETCGWQRDTGNYDADRMAGRRHAENWGHLVVAYSERTIRWDGRVANVVGE